MKKATAILLSLIMIVSIVGCSNKKTPSSDNTQKSSSDSTTVSPGDSTPKSESSTDSSSGQSATKNSNILIAYFTMPEDVNTAGVDAIASASIVVKDGKALGNTQYMAQVIQQTAGGDLFSIETVQQYPLDHDPLVDQAAAEQKKNARPKLATHVENMEDYDIIFLGYPNWWGDLPMPLYTFLEEYDLSGKTIIPFCPHGGNGFSRTVSTIAEMQPKATVSKDGLTVSRNNVADSEAEVKAWLKEMGMLK
ncbi:Flavodoxin [Desulfosporosinus lacus DSM 15449]|uniref:Flavodoxin n=1 Tax=Desulfosporosinus lacus DSM 15449 TaxID=1121420 RepID=A0A1M6DNU3_9FIRM|nr:Flavodoxin [Desulfosporosinus lacus DSM 15449]